MHECPTCGSSCHCNGDIDDCLIPDKDVSAACTHCVCKKCKFDFEDCTCICPGCENPYHSCCCCEDLE